MVGMYVEFKAKFDEVDKAFAKMNAESTKVQANQTKVTKAISGTISSVGSLTASFVKMGAALGAVVAGGALVAFGVLWHTIGKIAEEIDSVTDAARGLGVSAQGLQSLGYAASLSGVEMGSLENSMKKLGKSIGDAMGGNKGLQDTFKQLGISMESLKGLSLDQQFLKVADAIGKVDDKNIQASLSAQLFGKSYTDVLNLVRDGVGQNVEEFNKLGIALTDSQRVAVDAFGDSKDKLQAIWQGFGQKVVAYLAEPFEKMITWITNTIEQMGGIDSAAQAFAKAIVSGVQFAVNAIQGLISVIDGLYARMLKLQIFALESANKLDKANIGQALAEKIGLDTQGSGADRQLGRNAEIKSLYKDLNANEQSQAKKGDFFKPLQDMLEAGKNSIGVLESYIPPIKTAAENTQKFSDALATGTEKIDDAISKMITTSGQSKLQSLIGTGNNGAPAIEQQSVEQWDDKIRNIYMKALAGKVGARGDLNQLQTSIAEGTNAGNAGSLTDYIGAIQELRKFVDKVDPAANKTKLDITVKTDKGFNLEIAQSSEVQKQVNAQINAVAQNAARMGAK